MNDTQKPARRTTASGKTSERIHVIITASAPALAPRT
jgi:hypothetical protein